MSKRIILLLTIALAGCSKKAAEPTPATSGGDDKRYIEIKDKMCSCTAGDTACGQLAATAMEGWVALHSKKAPEMAKSQAGTDYEKCKTTAMTPAAGGSAAAGSGSGSATGSPPPAGSGS